MLVLVTYDVSTQTALGRKRLRKVSKVCQNYGQRVQNSVFECIVDSGQLITMKLKLLEIIEENEDSLRIYQLGNNYKAKIEHVGMKPSVDLEAPLIF